MAREIIIFDDPDQSFLTPYGAFFGQNTNLHPFDWNNNAIYSLWPFDITTFKIVHTSGQYATWTRIAGPGQTDIHLRNLATGSDATVITTDEYNAENDVGPNGIVVYEQGHSLYKYYNNTTTLISENAFSSDTVFRVPVTDGNYVLYLKETSCCGEDFLWLYDGNSNILLSSPGNILGGILPTENYYQVKNKFVAYLKPGTSGQMQVWLRDSTGVNSQVSFFGTSSSIERLNEKGDIMYLNNGTRYLAEKGVPQPKALGPGIIYTKVVYRDSSWYLIEGSHVYRILAHAFITVSDGNWNDPATWENGIVPPSNADVIILNNVIVNVNASCNTLNVHAPGHVTVSPGVTFTILH